jgi:hypothetical protein
MKYIFYKHKVAGPIPDNRLNEFVSMWITMVDSGKVEGMKDTPFLNKDMEGHPNDVHILTKLEKGAKHE